MSRSKKSVTAGKLHAWAIYRIKSTPARLLGYIEAPDEQSAIQKAIGEFNVTSPQIQKSLLARRRS
jgi:hypothetical protein